MTTKIKFYLPVLALAFSAATLRAEYTETMDPNGVTRNLTDDYGLKDDKAKADQSAVFQKAIDDLASEGGGRLVVPKGTYRLAGVKLRSNIHLLIEKGTVFKPFWAEGTKTVVFTLGADHLGNKKRMTAEKERAFIENVSLRGLGGRWIIDYSDRERKEDEGIRGVMAKMVRNFLIADLDVKDNFTVYCGITLSPMQTEQETKDWPVSRATDGTILNCRIFDASPGYGLTQLHGAQSVHFEDIYARGGVTLRLETGAVGDKTAIYDITAKNVVNENGRSAVMFGPHSAVNGLVKVDGVVSKSSAYAVTISLGGVKEAELDHNPGATDGTFAEGSYVKNIRVVFGRKAQVKTHAMPEIPEEYFDELNLRWEDKFFEAPSIGAVRDTTGDHYHIEIENVTMKGFKHNGDKPILKPADFRPDKWWSELEKWKATHGSEDTAADKPNVLIIYTDDQGYGDVSCLNPESKFQTPNIDRLIQGGINFTHGHSAGSACTPSRYALMTGRYPWRTTLKSGVGDVDEPSMIAEDRLTIGQMLQQNGYDTACVGKWHLGMQLPGSRGQRDWSQPIKQGPVDRGFDYWFGIPVSPKLVCAWFENRGLAPGAAEPTLLTHHKKNLPKLGPRWRIMKPYYTDLKDQPEETIQNKKFITEVAPDWEDDQLLTRYTDKAMEWIGEKADDAKNEKPFFLYLSLTSPHEPVAPRADFIGKSGCAGYGDFVMETDFHIGRLLDHLEETGLAENTLILFSSDNGPESTWKDRIKEFGHHSSGILKEGKRSHYEGGHRVPFAIRWPAKIEAGRVWDRPVCQVDLIATLAEIVGTDVPDHAAEDSQSFADVLTHPSSEFERIPMISNNSRSGQFAITEGQWKLIMPSGNSDRELYDLVNDISETNNLIKQHPEVAETLEAKLTNIVCDGRSTPGANQVNDTGWWPALSWMTPESYKAIHPKGEPPAIEKRQSKSRRIHE